MICKPIAYRWQSPIGGWAYGEKLNQHAWQAGYVVEPIFSVETVIGLLADAERYRTWRDEFLSELRDPLGVNVHLSDALGNATTADEIDAALDAARKA